MKKIWNILTKERGDKFGEASLIEVVVFVLVLMFFGSIFFIVYSNAQETYILSPQTYAPTST